jgi:hypothetical protein
LSCFQSCSADVIGLLFSTNNTSGNSRRAIE